jgi:hypothetical protein
MKEKLKNNLIQEFEGKIKEHEDILFGMNLYYQGICFVWKHDKEIIELNRKHYKDIEKRMTTAIDKSKQLLGEAKQNFDKLQFIQQFKFPLTKGDTILNEGTKLAKALVKTYEEIFPDRPKTKLLTEEESLRLKVVASEKI